MSRSGYTDDCEHLELYRATVERALHGKRGQAFLLEMAAALDAMPIKELIAGELINEHGKCCAIGAVCKARSLDVSRVVYYDPDAVADVIGVAPAMAAEIAYENDEGDEPFWRVGLRPEEPAERWLRMRTWVTQNLRQNPL